MITSWIFNIFFWALNLATSPIRALADVSLDSNFSASITAAGAYLALLNQILPIPTLLTIIGLLIVCETGILLFKLVKFAYKKIPGIN